MRKEYAVYLGLFVCVFVSVTTFCVVCTSDFHKTEIKISIEDIVENISRGAFGEYVSVVDNYYIEKEVLKMSEVERELLQKAVRSKIVEMAEERREKGSVR